MNADECRANAWMCYESARRAADVKIRRALFDLMVRWHELAAKIDQNGAECERSLRSKAAEISAPNPLRPRA